MRFQFSEVWTDRSLADLMDFQNGLNAESGKYGRGIKFISVGDILENDYITYDSIKGQVDASEKEKKTFSVQLGDIVFQRSSETPSDIGRSNAYLDLRPCLFGGFVIRGRKKADYQPYFLKTALQSPTNRKKVVRLGAGAQHFNIGQESLKTVSICLPSMPEQEKIASIFMKISKRIEIQSKIIEEYSLLRKRIADSLIAMFPERFEKVLLKSVLNERNEKNDNNYPVYSVAVEAGVVNQIEHLGRSFAARETAHYHVVHRGDVIYTKSPTGSFPCGIIKQSNIDENVAVSPLYGVYEPCKFEIGHFLHYYFLNETNANNYLRPLVDKGAKNTMNITNRRFLEGCAWVPKREFVLSISNLLSTIESNYQAARKMKELYNAQKTFFLQNLFI